MINECQLSQIVYDKKSNYLSIKFNQFNSPLKTYVNKIYKLFNLPKESIFISMFYLLKLHNINKNINIREYIFVSIVVSCKYILDHILNLKLMCEMLEINYNDYCLKEIEFLRLIKWELYYDINDYNNIKQKIKDLKICI